MKTIIPLDSFLQRPSATAAVKRAFGRALVAFSDFLLRRSASIGGYGLLLIQRNSTLDGFVGYLRGRYSAAGMEVTTTMVASPVPGQALLPDGAPVNMPSDGMAN